MKLAGYGGRVIKEVALTSLSWRCMMHIAVLRLTHSNWRHKLGHHRDGDVVDCSKLATGATSVVTVQRKRFEVTRLLSEEQHKAAFDDIFISVRQTFCTSHKVECIVLCCCRVEMAFLDTSPAFVTRSPPHKFSQSYTAYDHLKRHSRRAPVVYNACGHICQSCTHQQ